MEGNWIPESTINPQTGDVENDTVFGERSGELGEGTACCLRRVVYCVTVVS